MNLPNRPLLILFITSYLLSVYLLALASASKSPLPVWGGVVDVGLVIALVLLSFTVFARGKANPDYQTSHRAALNIFPLVLLGVWILRNSLDLNILLPGLAWRMFLLLHILPYAANLWRRD
jgi:hypothetical protein